MTQSQAEIKAIQAKLQAIQAGRTVTRPGPIPHMVELTPTSTPDATNTTKNTHNGATATVTPPRQQQQYIDLTATAETLHQRANAYINQSIFSQSQSQPQPRPQPHRTVLEQHVVDTMKRLEAQVRHINQLSAAQETALLELKAIAQKAERDWRAADLEYSPFSEESTEGPLICEYVATAVPHIQKDENGLFVLTTRSVDLFRAEREASLMAQSLRHRKPTSPKRKHNSSKNPRSRQSQENSWGQMLLEGIVTSIQSLTTYRPASVKVSHASSDSLEVPTFSLTDAAMWVIGAIVIRVGLDLLLASFPGLWIPVIALIATPAAIAAYRTTVAPHSGLVWGYRLLLLMIGLLIGGRL
jgi:hypothetical protein